MSNLRRLCSQVVTKRVHISVIYLFMINFCVFILLFIKGRKCEVSRGDPPKGYLALLSVLQHIKTHRLELMSICSKMYLTTY